jgi:hypothetical protein
MTQGSSSNSRRIDWSKNLGMAIVQLYRSHGFATVWLAMSVNLILSTAAHSHYLQDPGFVWQSNLLVAIVGLLLIAGIWGYSQGGLRTRLSALAVDRQ